MENVFNGISELQKNKIFKILATHIYTFNKNEEIIPTLKRENVICIMLEGHANIININYNGETDIIEELSPNSVFGTYLSDIHNNEYQIIAIENSKVLVIDYNKLLDLKNINYTYFCVFIMNLFHLVNIKIEEKNMRIRILTQKSIRDKLLTYFSAQYQLTHSKYIYLPNNFKVLADYLAVNRSAMFRELKYLKDEKFIKVDKKRITLLYTPTIF